MTAWRNTPESVRTHWREHSLLHDDALIFSNTSQSESLFAVSDFIVPDLQLQRFEEVHSTEGSSSNLTQAVTTKKRYSSSNNALMRNRTRRVIVPVIGNNKVGKRGKIRCMECRRIHIKGASLDNLSNIQCIFDSDEAKCENCSSKNLECVKVWGPKTESWLNAVAARITVESVPPSVSLIWDINLSCQENSRLQRIYHYTIENPDSFSAIILQNLWTICGWTFDDEALLYSILAWHAGETRPPSPKFSNTLPVFRTVSVKRFSKILLWNFTSSPLFLQCWERAARQI